MQIEIKVVRLALTLAHGLHFALKGAEIVGIAMPATCPTHDEQGKEKAPHDHEPCRAVMLECYRVFHLSHSLVW